MRALLVGLVTAATLLVPSASGKNFGPGDVRVCNATRCVPIVSKEVLPRLGTFYGGSSAERVGRAPLGSPYYELRFRNGFVTGIVATRQLDRFLSYGVHLEAFERNQWYSVPPRLSAEFRRLTTGLRPLHVTSAALARSR